ncbi:MAG: hypothetical protein U5K69_06575 [Balneolaceae bacterium]|nr:hypothetical protein [Balneolaceae bacterium]
MEKENTLANLLNDESFLRWLRDDAKKSEENKWKEWLYSDPKRKAVIEKAKKINSMPFREWHNSTEKFQQLEKLKHALQETSNLKLFKG